MFKSFSVYFISNVISAIAPFILLPVLTNYLTLVEYGQVAIFMMIYTSLPPIIGMCTNAACNRVYFDDENERDKSDFISTCLTLSVILSIVTCIFIFLFSRSASFFFGIELNWLYVAVISSLAMFINSVILGQWQARKKALKFGAFTIFNAVMALLATIVTVVMLDMGADGRILAILFSGGISLIVAFYYIYKDRIVESFFRFDKKHLKSALEYSLPLIPHSFGALVISQVDRLVIKEYLGLEYVAIYMAAFQLSLIVKVFVVAANNAYTPWLYERLKRSSFKCQEEVKRFSTLSFGFVILMSIPLLIISPYLSSFILDERYYLATSFVGILFVSQLIQLLYFILAGHLFFNKNTSTLFYGTLMSGLISFLLSVVLIKTNGLLGVAVAFLIGKIFLVFFTYISVRKNTGFKYIN